MSYIQLENGKYLLLDNNTLYEFSDNIPENILSRFENYGKDKENDLFKLVKKHGLEKEYCLVFMNQIMFHSPLKNECDNYEKQHSSISFVRYGPI